jgi:hypothetical protein
MKRCLGQDVENQPPKRRHRLHEGEPYDWPIHPYSIQRITGVFEEIVIRFGYDSDVVELWDYENRNWVAGPYQDDFKDIYKYTKWPKQDGSEFHILLPIIGRLLVQLNTDENLKLKQLKRGVLERWHGAYQCGIPIIQTRDLLHDILSMLLTAAQVPSGVPGISK